MTERNHNVPNARSPGTPVCHPNDAYAPLPEETRKSFTIVHPLRTTSANYVELHAASAFSFLEAGSQPEALIERAAELEMPAMAIADRNGVYGAARFHTSGQRSGVRAHIGAEVAVKSFGERLKPPAWLPHQCAPEPARLTLLCESRQGYQNLCQLITQFKMREPTKQEGAANFSDLEQYASGLVCLTGGDEGPLAAALTRGGEEAGAQGRRAARRASSAAEMSTSKLQRHREREEEWRNQAAIRIARALQSAGARHQRRSLRQSLRPRNPRPLHRHPQPHRTRPRRPPARHRTANAISAPRAKWQRCFAMCPEPSTTRSNFRRGSRSSSTILAMSFRAIPCPTAKPWMSFLRKRVAEGVAPALRTRKTIAGLMERAKKQVEHELALIAKLGFAGYFLIVWDIVQFCQTQRHPGAGPRQRRELRRVLRARNYRHRSGRNGTALRALPERKPRRVARHRPRSALRSEARAGHPICLPALRRTGRSHDRQCHHLSRQIRRARNRQGSRLR